MDHLAGEARAGCIDGRNARGRPNGTPYAKRTTKVCTTLFADRKQAYKLCPRMLYTEKYRTDRAANNPGDQSGPRKFSHASSSARQPRHQELTPAEAHSSRRSVLYKKASPPWKERVCADGDRVRRQKPRPKRATRHAQAQAQANTLMTYYGYGGRNP